MKLGFLDSFLWAATFVGQLVLFGVILARHRVRELPIFTVLIAHNLLRTSVLYAIHVRKEAWAYFYAYWIFAVIDLVLYLLVFVESALYTYRSSDFRSRPSTATILSCGLGGVLVAVTVAWLAPVPGNRVLNDVIVRGNLVASTLLSELFTAMVAFSGRAGIPWRTHPARVVQGLGVFALTGLVINAVQGFFGVSTSPIFRILSRCEISVYALCLGYWIITLYRDAPERKQMTTEMRQQLSEIAESAARAAKRLRPL